MCGGSPLFLFFFCFIGFSFVVSCRGEYTGRSTKLYTLVLPSLNRISLFILLVLFHVGENTQGSLNYDTLVLPSLNRI